MALQRVMDVGFVDGGGKMYRPSVVRVGSEDAPIQPRARDVWVETLIKCVARFHVEVCRRVCKGTC